MYIAPVNSNYAYYIKADKFIVTDSEDNVYGKYTSESTAKMAVNVIQNRLMAEHVKKYPPTSGLFDESKLKKTT